MDDHPAALLIEELRTEFGLPITTASLDERLEDLGLDSLAIFEVVVFIEDRREVVVQPGLEPCTVRDVLDLIDGVALVESSAS